VLKIRDFIQNVVLRVFCITLLALPIPLYISRHYTQWKGLFATSLVFFPILVIAIYFIGLTKPEKATMLRFAKNKMAMFSK
jgi:hypothetical protein